MNWRDRWETFAEYFTLANVLALSGVVSVGVGLGLWALPLAFIWAGLWAMAAGYWLEIKKVFPKK